VRTGAENNARKRTVETSALVANVAWVVAGAGAVGTSITLGVEW